MLKKRAQSWCTDHAEGIHGQILKLLDLFNCIPGDYVLKECEPVSSATALTLEHLMLQINALEIDMPHCPK